MRARERYEMVLASAKQRELDGDFAGAAAILKTAKPPRDFDGPTYEEEKHHLDVWIARLERNTGEERT